MTGTKTRDRVGVVMARAVSGVERRGLSAPARRLRSAVAALAAVVTVSACTTAVSGVALPATAGSTATRTDANSTSATGGQPSATTSGATPTTPTTSTVPHLEADEIDLPTDPLVIPEFPESDYEAARQEGRRLAEWVAVPTDIDSNLASPTLTIGPLGDAVDLKLVLGSGAAAARVMGAGFLAGFSTSRWERDEGALSIAVLIFEDAKGAQEAVALLAQDADSPWTLRQVPGVRGGVNEAQVVPGGLASWAALAHGQFVIHVTLEDIAGTADVVSTFTRAFTRQIELLTTFVPRTRTDLAKVPSDPDGLRARTIPQPIGTRLRMQGLYTAPGIVHLSPEPEFALQPLELAGVDLVALGRTKVFRARDADAAERLARYLMDDLSFGEPVELTGLAGPGRAECVGIKDEVGFGYCLATVGRYVVEYWSFEYDDAERTTKAQVELLAGEW